MCILLMKTSRQNQVWTYFVWSSHNKGFNRLKFSSYFIFLYKIKNLINAKLPGFDAENEPRMPQLFPVKRPIILAIIELSDFIYLNRLNRTGNSKMWPWSHKLLSKTSNFCQSWPQDGRWEIFLTLTRPISLPPHAPVAQKIADKRWFIAYSAKNR